jgi:hypothetical protein
MKSRFRLMIGALGLTLLGVLIVVNARKEVTEDLRQVQSLAELNPAVSADFKSSDNPRANPADNETAAE